MKSFAQFLAESFTIRGEWWITDSGVLGADEYGDDNHESYVVHSLHRELADNLGVRVNDYHIDWDAVTDQAINAYCQEHGLDRDDVNDNEILVQVAHEAGITDEQLLVANGQSDAREYAMEYWGWYAVRGHYIDTWNLSPADMQSIASGIGEILDQEGLEESEDDDQEEFTVTVYKTGKSYTLSLGQLRAGTMQTQNPFVTQIGQTNQNLGAAQVQHNQPNYYWDRAWKQQMRTLSLKTKGVLPPEDQEEMPEPKYPLKPGVKWWAQQSETVQR